MPSFSRPSLTLLTEATPAWAEPLPASPWPAVATDDAWRLDALCAETDPEAFFPEKGGSTREAKRVCSGCEVRAECLESALANDERFGIWGGLSERERRRLRLQRQTPLSA
ncbi:MULTISPECIES: WhiB family transcriptional regulator [unclassified Geodermatophilus]|uniref:WhiB family transcriptional regulator n=1 Tax=unclassified Geodermatophilus TaxID=2637632 RepID=UPI003F53D707